MNKEEKIDCQNALYDIGSKIQELGRDLTNEEYVENITHQVKQRLEKCKADLQYQIDSMK